MANALFPPIPKFMIGERVIAKLWAFYNVCEIKSAYYNPENNEWRYTVSAKGLLLNHTRGEEEIRKIK